MNIEHTKGPWHVRERRSPSGELLDCFVSGPTLPGEPYAQEILGDDYTGFDGKDAMQKKHADCQRVVACFNACEGITTQGLESFIAPPEGSLGLPHGSWAGQLKALWDDNKKLTTELEQAGAYRDLTFDGYKILQHLTDKAKQRTSAENVADVLDALNRAAKAAMEKT